MQAGADGDLLVPASSLGHRASAALRPGEAVGAGSPDDDWLSLLPLPPRCSWRPKALAMVLPEMLESPCWALPMLKRTESELSCAGDEPVGKAADMLPAACDRPCMRCWREGVVTAQHGAAQHSIVMSIASGFPVLRCALASSCVRAVGQ